MARSIQGAFAARTSSRKARLILGSAIASLALASCAASAPPAQVSFNKAQSALESGKISKAITFAEAAVLASPRDPEYRATLGAAYLEAGRYESAATAFGDAIELGDNRGRTVLSYALTKVATGDDRAAVSALQARQNSVPRADLGLALALAGEADRGVEILVEAIRNGNATPKARQNLAYAYALAGNWRAARVMASEDVPADQLDARLSAWAASARPEDNLLRVSNLLGLAPASDGGQPQHLALANFPSQPEMVAEAAQMAKAEPVPTAQPSPAEPRESEVLAFGQGSVNSATNGSSEPAPVAQSVPASVVAVADPQPAPVVRPAPRFVSNAVVQKIETSTPAPSVAARSQTKQTGSAPRNARAAGSADTHRVQLGAFNSREVAEQKWREFQRRYPSLKGRDVVITEAQVNGRTFFRVAAAGFGERSARSMCGAVKATGGGCFAYAKSSPPAGAVKRSVRVAARTR
ncbi:MAG: tetratricopeptide repeat protein [Pseudomonadota bacterium]